MEPAQPITTHGHAGVCACPAGGQGTMSLFRPAKAVSMGSQPLVLPQEATATPLTALIGIIEGAKNNIAPINIVLTILRSFICRPDIE
jgi:hypothetical protein